MARYLVLRKSFIDGALLEEGEEVEYSGIPGSALKLISGESPVIELVEASATGIPGSAPTDLETLRQQYEEIFNEKPHFNTGAAKLQAAIDEKRKELGVN